MVMSSLIEYTTLFTGETRNPAQGRVVIENRLMQDALFWDILFFFSINIIFFFEITSKYIICFVYVFYLIKRVVSKKCQIRGQLLGSSDRSSFLLSQFFKIQFPGFFELIFAF